MYFDMQAMSDSVEYFAKNPETKAPFIDKRESNELGFIAERKYINYVERKQ